MSASRSTVSFSQSNWKHLSKEKNKSKVVNEALDFYIKTKKLLRKKEQDFLLDELANFQKTKESYSFEETFS